MLINEEQTKELVNRIIAAAKVILHRSGVKKVDPTTGFEHLESRLSPFVLVEHQRQTLEGGKIKTNGLDIWHIMEGDARKLLSVNYMPFDIRSFNKSGKAEWIDVFLELGKE